MSRSDRSRRVLDQRTNFSVAQTAVDEGEQLAGRGRLGDVLAAAGFNTVPALGDLDGAPALDGLYRRPPHQLGPCLVSARGAPWCRTRSAAASIRPRNTADWVSRTGRCRRSRRRTLPPGWPTTAGHGVIRVDGRDCQTQEPVDCCLPMLSLGMDWMPWIVVGTLAVCNRGEPTRRVIALVRAVKAPSSPPGRRDRTRAKPLGQP